MKHYKTKRCGCTLHIVIADSDCEYGKIQAKLDKQLDVPKIRGALALTYISGKSRYMLFNRRTLDISVAGHEVYHMVKSLKYKDEEREANLAGALMEWLIKRVVGIQ